MTLTSSQIDEIQTRFRNVLDTHHPFDLSNMNALINILDNEVKQWASANGLQQSGLQELGIDHPEALSILQEDARYEPLLDYLPLISSPQPGVMEHPGGKPHLGFAFCELMGRRDEQEDALAWQILPDNEACDDPEETGHRLWTSLKIINGMLTDETDGATASVTVYDGHGNLITATLADSEAFAAIYDKDGRIRNVIRLNSCLHNPWDPDEVRRIRQAGGMIINHRVIGTNDFKLAVTRALGDRFFTGVIADSKIDINCVDHLISKSGLTRDEASDVQVITVCDGYLESVHDDSKSGKERYLLRHIQQIQDERGQSLNVRILARDLAEKALHDQSEDNISVAVMTVTLQPKQAQLTALFDGHGGSVIATKAAQNIGRIFQAQWQLSPEDYKRQDFSVDKNQAEFFSDNPVTVPVSGASSGFFFQQAASSSDQGGVKSPPSP